jgi:hypothetical protein
LQGHSVQPFPINDPTDVHQIQLPGVAAVR